MCHAGGVPDHYFTGATIPVTLAGEQFAATVHLAQVGRTVRCVGIDLRSVVIEKSTDAAGQEYIKAQPYDPPQPLGHSAEVGWNEVNAQTWRELRVGELVKDARERTKMLVAHFDLGEDHLRALRATPDETKPGPAPKLDGDALMKVAAAWGNAPARGRTTAVRRALVAILNDPGVNENQAKKAIAAARGRGLIPES